MSETGDWSLAEWNSALVQAVFLLPAGRGSRMTLSRIDSTGRIFQQISLGEPIEQARHNFLMSFGRSPAAIREAFSWSPKVAALTAKNGIPSCFAALYLSLLAASADDRTYTEGNFRTRFASLLDIPLLSNFSFSELPHLWEHVAKWSANRSQSDGDCLRLVLPDRHHETLIGYSKRLAFPSYKDELLLRDVLRRNHVDSSSAFEDVSAAIYREPRNFSGNFREELDFFGNLVQQRQLQEAYDSPFWGAVRDITLEQQEEDSQRNGLFAIQLDLSDPQFPQLSLTADAVAARAVGPAMLRLSRSRGQQEFVWQPAEGYVSLDGMLALAGRHTSFANSRPGRALKHGALIFLPDTYGSLTTDGSHSDGACIALVLRPDLYRELELHLPHLGLHRPRVDSDSVLGAWVLAFHNCASPMVVDRLRLLLPPALGRWLNGGWHPPRPRLSGGSWYGQALLLAPASNPIVRMEGATQGKFEVLAPDSAVLTGGKLVEFEDGFAIPPNALANIHGAATCKYVLSATGRADASLIVPAITQIPTQALPKAYDASAWLVSGSEGVLDPLDECISRSASMATERSNTRMLPLVGRWPLLDVAVSLPEHSLEKNTAPIEPVVAWLCEALLLRFYSRASISFDEFTSHLRMASMASGIPLFRLKKALLGAGWLCAAERRTAPYQSVLAGPRCVSVRKDGQTLVARISGMLSLWERSRLETWLQHGESARMLVPGFPGLWLGATEVRLVDPNRVSELARELQLHQLPELGPPTPVGLVAGKSEVQLVERLPKEEGIQAWNWRKHAWEPLDAENSDIAASLVRKLGQQRNRFWIRSEDGGYLCTDSDAWAFLLSNIASTGTVGTLGPDGYARWAPEIRRVPFGISLWWQHRGGGCIGIDEHGHLAFAGEPTPGIWSGVCLGPMDTATRSRGTSAALTRRALALRLRRQAGLEEEQ